MAVAQAGLAHIFATLNRQPPLVQTDHGACFLGAEGGATAAVPSRLTLWLWGLEIEHRFIPVRHPQSNGAVERLHGGLKQAWAGEAGGVDDLLAVWNVDKPPLAADHRPYVGRAGFDWRQVWRKLSQVCVQRRVDRQGTLSLWDHPVRVGRQTANQVVSVTFDAEREQVVVHDEHEVLLAAVALPWLTEDWLWADVPLPDQGTHPPVTSTSP
jgi:transposase InsO family protein